MISATPVPVRDTVGAALRFVRENWQFVLSVAGIAAAGQGVILIAGPNPIWMIAVLLAVVTAHTALTSAALGIPRPFTARLPGDSARVGAAMTMIGILLVMIFFVLMFVGMSVLVAPYQAEVQAAGENQAALEAIMTRALEEQPQVLFWTTIIGVVIAFAISTRFYLAAPATVDRNRITLIESWVMTRGNFLRITGARLLLLAPAAIFVGALQMLGAALLGAPGGDPIAMVAYAQASPVGFAGFYTLSIFLQLAVFSALEAGLSANIYRSVRPPAA